MADKINKQESVRRALAKLGNDAKPTVIQGFVKQHFGIEMNKDHISVCKGKILREKAAESATRQEAPPRAKVASNAKNRIVLDDILAVKALAERVGPDQLLKLIDAFAE